MRCEQKADVARANASNKTVTYPNTRVITNGRGHVGFTYTRVDKLHQTLRRPSAEGILNPIRIYNESLSYLLTAESLGTRLIRYYIWSATETRSGAMTAANVQHS